MAERPSVQFMWMANIIYLGGTGRNRIGGTYRNRSIDSSRFPSSLRTVGGKRYLIPWRGGIAVSMQCA